jgi:putative peptide zinc metalloprotease protein
MRSDLQIREQRYQGRTYWVVKEPVGLKYFRLQPEEHAVLQMLDGQISADEIREAFERRFAPQKLTFDTLQSFLGQLHQNALVISTSQGQGRQLRERRDKNRRRELWQRWSNVLAIRFRGIDPERLLDRLYPWTSWFFTRTALVACCLLALSALGLLLVQFPVFHARLPAFEEFFGPRNWIWFAVVIGATKVLHEFGHGLACKHFGGECHEMGVMFLVLTPCLYCNVSDSWLLPNKWSRAAIGAAGIYVEVILASLATFVWWFTDPGLVNYLALRVMFVCSVSTVLFNGNPLLRYDGYYILSDLIEIPNLRQKASSILNRLLARWCLGMELPDDPFLPQKRQWLFALYTVASVIYRWVVVISILIFLNSVFKPYGLQVVGQTLAVVSIATMLLQPAWKLKKFLLTPGRMDQVKRRNVWSTVGVVGGLVALVLLAPLPRRVVCSLEVRAIGASQVYIEVPGRLEEVWARAGEPVEAGELLARLSNLDLEISVAELQMQQQENQMRLASLVRSRFDDESAGDEIPQVEKTLAALADQLSQKTAERRRLEVIAPEAGTILPAASRAPSAQKEGTLPTWRGSLLDARNQGATIVDGAVLCEIGDPNQLEAVLVIDQADVQWIAKGQEVEVVLDAAPGRTFRGRIEEVAVEEMKTAPRSLSNQAGGDLATRTDASGAQQPLTTSYIARVPLENLDSPLQLGLRGRAIVYTGYQPLGGRIWRYLSHKFFFAL